MKTIWGAIDAVATMIPLMLVRLAAVQVDDLRLLLEQAWRMVAPKRLVRDRFATKEGV